MRAIILMAGISAVGLFLACSEDETASTGGPGTTSSNTTSSTASGGGSTSTGGMTSSTSAGGNPQGGQGGSQGGGGDPCMANSSDSTCVACGKMSCCTELTTCYADPDCQCVADCIIGGGGFQMCGQMCSVTAPPPGAQELVQCLYAMCTMGDPPPCMLPN